MIQVLRHCVFGAPNNTSDIYDGLHIWSDIFPIEFRLHLPMPMFIQKDTHLKNNLVDMYTLHSHTLQLEVSVLCWCVNFHIHRPKDLEYKTWVHGMTSKMMHMKCCSNLKWQSNVEEDTGPNNSWLESTRNYCNHTLHHIMMIITLSPRDQGHRQHMKRQGFSTTVHQVNKISNL